MSTSTCTRCGAALDPGRAQGLCPRCLLAAAQAEPSAPEGVATQERSRRPPAPAVPTIEELAPLFPGLALEGLIAVGGMGAVYRATQKSLGRAVALKILHGDVAQEPGFAERFEREARTLAALSHPGIVTVHDFGVAGPHCYFVMEFVDGASLRQMIRAKEIRSATALRLVVEICEVLQYAHDRGVVHRDIKPENILVERSGRVKILDFGLSKVLGVEPRRPVLTRSSQVMGTPHYMAPEQWESPLEVDHRADIYALGVVFYELLTGELPLGRFAPPSRKVEIDVRLDEVVLRSLDKEPALRYQHASDVQHDVEHITRTRPEPAPAPPPLPLTGVAPPATAARSAPEGVAQRSRTESAPPAAPDAGPAATPGARRRERLRPRRTAEEQGTASARDRELARATERPVGALGGPERLPRPLVLLLVLYVVTAVFLIATVLTLF